MKGNGWVGGLIRYIRSNGGHNATKMVGKHEKKKNSREDADGATEDGDADGKWAVALAAVLRDRGNDVDRLWGSESAGERVLQQAGTSETPKLTRFTEWGWKKLETDLWGARKKISFFFFFYILDFYK